MKKKILVTSLSILALATAGFAEDEAAKGPKGPKGGKGPKGDMTPEQRADMMIKRADTDGNGELSKDELVAMFKQGRPGKPGARKPGAGKPGVPPKKKES